jgi:hypothetical protein
MNRLAASDSSRSGTTSLVRCRVQARAVAHAYGYDPDDHNTRTRRSAYLWIVAQLADLGAVKSTTATSL